MAGVDPEAGKGYGDQSQCMACGGLEWEYHFTRFPMGWSCRCRTCGNGGYIGIKPAAKPTAPPPKPRDDGDEGWGPFG